MTASNDAWEKEPGKDQTGQAYENFQMPDRSPHYVRRDAGDHAWIQISVAWDTMGLNDSSESSDDQASDQHFATLTREVPVVAF